MQAARESWQRLTYFLYWYYCSAHIDSRCFAGETFLNRSIFCSKIRKFVDLQFATRIYLQFFSYLKHIEQTSDYFKISANSQVSYGLTPERLLLTCLHAKLCSRK